MIAEDIIRGQTKEDAEKVHNDLNEILSGQQFAELRGLITRGKKNNKKQFDKIEEKALNNSISGL